LEQKLAEADRIDLTSFDLSKLSAEALDEVLGRASFSIASEDALLERLLNLDDEYSPLLSRIEIGFLSPSGLAILAERFAFPPECVCCGILDRLPRWNSAIVPDFPKLFEDFKKNHFTLLWRGSRDGFTGLDFHSRCDGHANTLTVILDTTGNVFGGFTPVKWESRKYNRIVYGQNCFKADPSLKSFLFTLKNPHKVPARRFALKAERKNQAICSIANCGPHFYDICVLDNCNANTDSENFGFGTIYTDDTGLDGDTFFTGSDYFQVKEIEVFELTE
jgi:hypothetical protein